ncbi:hypothetical protein T484DRAFT_1769895, partial [Baffinella frigidus]
MAEAAMRRPPWEDMATPPTPPARTPSRRRFQRAVVVAGALGLGACVAVLMGYEDGGRERASGLLSTSFPGGELLVGGGWGGAAPTAGASPSWIPAGGLRGWLGGAAVQPKARLSFQLPPQAAQALPQYASAGSSSWFHASGWGGWGGGAAVQQTAAPASFWNQLPTVQAAPALPQYASGVSSSWSPQYAAGFQLHRATPLYRKHAALRRLGAIVSPPGFSLSLPAAPPQRVFMPAPAPQRPQMFTLPLPQ